ncbi:MAG TPA: DNA repair protein RadA, partial [Polyangia bacterium]
MAKPSSRFVCQHCGHASAKWLGRCPECGEWNSLVEETAQSGKPAGAVSSTDKPRSIADVEVDHAPRMKTGVGELDRVLGGGLVAGSLVLLGGDPGIG